MKRTLSIKPSSHHENSSLTDLSQYDLLLTDKEAAKILNVTCGTLQVWRSTGRYKLPFVKVGRNVRYVQSSLIDWIRERTHLNEVPSSTTHAGVKS
jgi:excisionase family DNA binding protein